MIRTLQHWFAALEMVRSERSARGIDELVADRVERLGRPVADARDGGDAHDDDQREHDGILDGRWAIFTLQESLYVVEEVRH